MTELENEKHQTKKGAKKQEQKPLTKEEFFKTLDKVIRPVKPPPAKGKRKTSE